MTVPGNQVGGVDIHDHVGQVVEQGVHDERFGVFLARTWRADARHDEER